MAKRQTYLEQPVNNGKRHLRIVITDHNGENEYLTVSVDTLKAPWQDRSCILNVGDHPFIKHESFVNYRRAKVISFIQLFNGINKGLLIKKEDIGTDVLKRIQDGARKTKFLPTGLKDWFDLF